MAVLRSELIKFFPSCFKIKSKEEVSILITKIPATAGDWWGMRAVSHQRLNKGNEPEPKGWKKWSALGVMDFDFFCLEIFLGLKLHGFAWYYRSSSYCGSTHLVSILPGLYYRSPPQVLAVCFLVEFPSILVYICWTYLMTNPLFLHVRLYGGSDRKNKSI